MQAMELQEVTLNRAPGIHALLEKRFSPYKFSSRAVKPEDLRMLFEAARSAPSSYNEQPWRFVVATRQDTDAFESMVQTLVERNREWAQHAPVLVLSVAKLEFTHTGKPNRHAFYNVGQAAAYLTLQATALGLYVHQMAGFDAGKARQLLSIPEGYEPVSMMVVGYLDEPVPGTEPLRHHDRPQRARKPLESLAFEGTWGEPWSPAAEGESASRIQRLRRVFTDA